MKFTDDLFKISHSFRIILFVSFNIIHFLYISCNAIHFSSFHFIQFTAFHLHHKIQINSIHLIVSVMLLISPLLIFSTYYQQKNLIGKNKSNSDSLNKSNHIMLECLSNVKTVYSFNSENRMLNLFNQSIWVN